LALTVFHFAAVDPKSYVPFDPGSIPVALITATSLMSPPPFDILNIKGLFNVLSSVGVTPFNIVKRKSFCSPTVIPLSLKLTCVINSVLPDLK